MARPEELAPPAAGATGGPDESAEPVEPGTPAGEASRVGRGGAPAVALAVLAGSLGLALHVARAFGPWEALWSPEAGWRMDSPYYLYMLEAGRAMHAETGHLWGYEPHLLGGYPFAFLLHNGVLLQAIAVALPALAVGSLLRWEGIVLYALLPPLLHRSLRAFGAGRWAALAGTALGVAAALASEMELGRSGGQVLNFWSNVLVVPVLAAAHVALGAGDGPEGTGRGAGRSGRRGGQQPGALLALWTLPAVALLMHKSAVLLLPVPLAVMFVAAGRRAWPRGAVLYGLAATLALILNRFWLVPFVRHLGLRSVDHPAGLWQMRDPLRIVKEILTPVAGVSGWDPAGSVGPLLGSWAVRDLVLALGVAGLASLWGRGRRRLAAGLAGSLGYLSLLAYLGSWVPGLDRAEPFRYVIAVRLLWVVPAAFALEALADRARAGRPRALALVAPPAVALAAATLAPTFSDLIPPGFQSPGVPAEIAALEGWIEDEAPRRGRLLVEDAFARLETTAPLGGGYALGAVAARTGRELVSGPAFYTRLPHQHAMFLEGSAFGERLSEMNPETLWRALERYDVTAVAAWSPEARAAFDAFAPRVDAAGERGPYRVYRVARVHAPFASGAGEVEAAWGRLEVKVDEAAAGAVVLRYHWADRLVSEPAARLEPVRLDDDPVPFIRVVDPPPRFTLTLR